MKTGNQQENQRIAARLFEAGKVMEVLRTYRFVWLGPTIAFSVLGLYFALFKHNKWQATQAIVVRDEAIGELGFGSLGRFESSDTLKRSTETLLQVAMNDKVIEGALKETNPKKAHPPKPTKHPWPTARDIEDLRREISVTAPKGTEFGTTEVIYLAVTGRTPEQAISMTNAVCDNVERRMQELRDQNARSVIAELTQKLKLAEADLNTATNELALFERTLGSDLGEMRTLSETGSGGDSNLRAQLNQMKIELRQAEAKQEAQLTLLELLRTAGADTTMIIATPNQLLEFQPTLRRLKEGLVESRLRTARLRGALTNEHPRVLAAIRNEQNIREQLHREVDDVVAGIGAEIKVSQQMDASLRARLAEVQTKLDELATQRASYVNVQAKVTRRQEQLRDASAALTDARGRQEAAKASSLITRIDQPVTGSSPIGPGRFTILVGSGVSGLALGLSLVYIIAPIHSSVQGGRRKTDRFSRRASDEATTTNESATAEGRVPETSANLQLSRSPLRSTARKNESLSSSQGLMSVEDVLNIIESDLDR